MNETLMTFLFPMIPFLVFILMMGNPSEDDDDDQGGGGLMQPVYNPI